MRESNYPLLRYLETEANKELDKQKEGKMLLVKVECENCYGEIEVEYATDKTTLTCPYCKRKHTVTGLHVDGRPIIHLIAK